MNKGYNLDKYGTKLYYICCNLKSDLKFFETEEHGISKAYFNPKSGLVIDDNVTQSDKFEFYIQPQFVNEGTATPCHYQVMYYDKSQNEENELKIEEIYSETEEKIKEIHIENRKKIKDEEKKLIEFLKKISIYFINLYCIVLISR